jgi:hypothetical protein
LRAVTLPHLLPALLTLTLSLGLAGCGDDDPPVPVIVQPTLESIQAEVFLKSCTFSSCHIDTKRHSALGGETMSMLTGAESCAALIKQARAKAYGGQFFNVSFVGSKALAEELGDTGAGVTISQVMPFPYTPSSAIVREYQQRMTEGGHKDFDFSSMEGFLVAKVFAEGLRRAGKGLTRESLVTALESMRDYNMGGFTVNYSPQSHEGSRFTDLTIIGRGGKFMR